MPVIAKCGLINIHHFAHKVSSDCDLRYHDGISEWHLKWQYERSPPELGINIEVPLRTSDYLKRADVITPSGVIIEFQKSPMPIEERVVREGSYKNMIWVIHPEIERSKTWLFPGTCLILVDRGEYLERLGDGNHIRLERDLFVKVIINGCVCAESIFKARESRIKQDADERLLFWYFNKCIPPRDSLSWHEEMILLVERKHKQDAEDRERWFKTLEDGLVQKGYLRIVPDTVS